MNFQGGSHRSLSRLMVFLFIAGLVFTGIVGCYLAKRVKSNYQGLQDQDVLNETINQDQLSSLTAQNEEQANLISALQVSSKNKSSSIIDIYSTLSSLPKGSLTDSGTLEFQWQPGEINASVMIEGENVSLLSNDSGYITASTTDTLTNKTISALSNTISGLTVSNFASPNNSQWTNNSGYITASSLDNLTNKSGNISMWTNNAGYFVNGGNAFGALATLGTTDANGLAIITGGAEATRILTNGNFGIGSTNPGSKLVVYDATTSNGTVASFTRNSKTLGLYSNTASFNIGTQSNTGLGFFTNNSATQMVLDTSGRLGIGTAAPGARVEIDSGVSGTAGLKFSQLTSSTGTTFSNGKVLTVDASGNITWAYDQVGTAGSLPVGTIGQTLYHTGVDWAATSNLYNTGGRIGIGTTSPQDMLHVYGTDNAPGDGITPQHNSIIIDGVADGDKNLIFADAGTNKWALQTYRNEGGEFLYYYNYTSQKEPVVLTETGRFGLNNPSSLMSYHADFISTGSSEGMDVGGNYTGEFQLWYQTQIDGNGVPDTFRWRTSRDGLNWDAWTSGVSITGTDQTLNNGVTVKFTATTGHTIGDTWSFTAFSQTPRATLSVGPGAFDEVLCYNGANFVDETYNANMTGGTPLDLLDTTNDYEYFGMASKFNTIFLDISRPAVGAVLVVEYWSGAAWMPLTLGSHNLQDFTNNLTEDGQITFDKSLLTGWVKNTVYDYVDLYYWIRISTSANPTTVPQFLVASPAAANRIGVYAGAYDTAPVFAVNAVGTTTVGEGLSVAGASTLTGLLTANGGVSIGVGQSYTGAGAVILSSAAGTNLSVTSGTTGNVIIDSGSTGAISMGTGAAVKTITIGNVTGATKVDINSGTGDINLNPTVNDTHISGGYGSTGVTVSNVGNIQANGALTIDGTSTLAGLVTATGGVTIADGASYTGTGAVNITSATASALNIDSGTTGALNIGTGVNAKTIAIGNTHASTALVLRAGTDGLNAGAGVLNLITGGATAFSLNSTGDGTLTGDLTITGNHIYMGSNVLGSILVADGAKFNPVALSGDATVAANGTLALNYVGGQAADSTTKGFLTAADWNTFFGKQAALGYTAENVTNKSTDIATDGASDTKYASAKAVKTYADNLSLGLNWKNPVEGINEIGDSDTPIAAPANYDAYIIKTGGNVGDWAAFAAGDLVQFQSPAWVKIKSLAVGDYLGIAFASSTAPMGSFAGKKNNIVRISGGVPGAFTYSFTAPSNNDAVYVQNINSYYHNVTYVYSTSLTQWVQLSAAVDYSYGNGLATAGTVVSLGALTADWNQTGVFNINTAGNVAVNGGSLTTSAASANLFNSNATTINFAGGATAINLGASGVVVSGAGTTTFKSGAASALTIDSGTTGALNIGTGAFAKSITIGNDTTTTGVTIDSGSGNINLNPTANSTKISGGYGSTGVTVSDTGNIQTNGGLTVDGASTLTGLASGTAGFSIADGQSYSGLGSVTLSSAAASALNISSGTTGIITIDSGTTGAINIGTSASAKTITIGNAASTAVIIGKLTTQYGVLYTSTAGGALAQTAAGSTGQCLIATTGGAPTWGSCSASAPFTKTGTNISPTTAGDDLLLNTGETLTIGGGTAITRHLSATATLNFPSIPNNSCSSLTITVTGAATGNTVTSTPTPVSAGIETFTTTTYNSYVSAANTVTVRACKLGTGTADPDAQTWRADVWQH